MAWLHGGDVIGPLWQLFPAHRNTRLESSVGPEPLQTSTAAMHASKRTDRSRGVSVQQRFARHEGARRCAAVGVRLQHGAPFRAQCLGAAADDAAAHRVHASADRLALSLQARDTALSSLCRDSPIQLEVAQEIAVTTRKRRQRGIATTRKRHRESLNYAPTKDERDDWG